MKTNQKTAILFVVLTIFFSANAAQIAEVEELTSLGEGLLLRAIQRGESEEVIAQIAANSLWHKICSSDLEPAEKVMHVEALLRHVSADSVNPSGTPLLCSAAGQNNSQVIELLLKKGARVNRKDPITGKTALHCAVENGFVANARLLLDCHANVNSAAYDGVLPLHSSISCRTETALGQLLEVEEVEVNAVNNVGQTALHLAAAAGNATMVRWLLDARADRDCDRAENYETPLITAKRIKQSKFALEAERYADVINLLETYWPATR